MALSQPDVMRVLESLRSSDGIELVRSVAERMLQELIEAEATAHIGAERNEHTASRTALRNGHRDKVLTMLAGDLDLEIPKVRTCSFFPSLLERRRRIDQALYAVINGLSVAFFEDEAAAQSAHKAIEKRAEEIGWNKAPHPAPVSQTIYQVVRHV